MNSSVKKSETAQDKLKKAVGDALRGMRTPHIFSHADIVSAKVSPADLRAALDEHGVVAINNAFTAEAFTAARSALRQAFKDDIEPQLLDANRPPGIMWPHIISSNEKYWKTGVVGNKSFGFLFCQPEKKEEAPKITFSGELEATMAPGSAYKANLALMTHPSSQAALATLMVVTGTTTGMISQDSAKMHRGVLTKPHVDIYSTTEKQLNRTQAMAIGPAEGNVRLCFARGSHKPEVQRWIADIVDKPNFYERTGFLGIPDKHRDTVLEALMPSFYVGAPGQLVMWRSGVVHVELQVKKDQSLIFRNNKKTTTERYVVGPHMPYKLTSEQLLEIGYVAHEHGLIFHPYLGNKDNAAGTNTVCHKSTQYKRPRTRCQEEKDRVSNAIAGIPKVAEWATTQHPRLLHCLGVSQASDAVFDDPAALRIFNTK